MRGETGPAGPAGPTGNPGPKGDTGDVGGFINIYGIVTSTDQLPNPDTLGNRTIAYLLGTGYPYDLYIQVGDADGPVNWVNSGPLNVSTLVFVNGEAQNTWDADTKVDKPTTTSGYNRVIGVDTGNNSMSFTVQYPNYSFNETGASSRNGIPAYSNGNIGCSMPLNDYHATPKKYVDDNFVAKTAETGAVVYASEGGTDRTVEYSSGAVAYSLGLRLDSGRLQVGTPSDANDATTKSYVDAQVSTVNSKVNNYMWYPIDTPKLYTFDDGTTAWYCFCQLYRNKNNNKRKIEYELLCQSTLTATSDVIKIDLGITSKTIGAKYNFRTIPYSIIPYASAISGGYWSFDSFTWDESTDIGSEVFSLPFRGNAGFEVKIAVLSDSPKSSITLKKARVFLTKYES